MKNLFVAVIRHTGASASSVAAALLPAWAMPMAGSAGAVRLGRRGALRGEVYGLQLQLTRKEPHDILFRAQGQSDKE